MFRQTLTGKAACNGRSHPRGVFFVEIFCERRAHCYLAVARRHGASSCPLPAASSVLACCLVLLLLLLETLASWFASGGASFLVTFFTETKEYEANGSGWLSVERMFLLSLFPSRINSVKCACSFGRRTRRREREVDSGPLCLWPFRSSGQQPDANQCMAHRLTVHAKCF